MNAGPFRFSAASPAARSASPFRFSAAGLGTFGRQRFTDPATSAVATIGRSAHHFSAEPDDPNLLPIRLFARSVGPAIHPYYEGGIVYHDFSGMTLARRRLLIDWRHGDAIGYFESYQLVPGVGLYLNGMLELAGDNGELARQVATEMAKGVPHEASIETDPRPTIEEIGEFSAGQVNGLTVRGPSAIVRKWELRGVAVCPYGSDSATRAELVGAGA